MAPLRLGSRKSALAQAQAHWVAEALRVAHPNLTVEIVLMTTTGDQRSLEPGYAPKDAPGGLKSQFTKEIEDALLQSKIDIAVHSLKDMPAELPAGLVLTAIPKREDPRDVWISRTGAPFADLPQGATVATGAVRRKAQLKHLRPDLKLEPMRGNVDTRLKKLREGDYEGIILALAGLKRLKRQNEATEILPTHVMLPAVGQGALAIETRENDNDVIKIAMTLDDAESHQTILAERSFLKTLGGSCQTPIAGYAQVLNHQIVLTGLVSGLDGQPFLQAAAEGPIKDSELIGKRLAQLLLARGADTILNGAVN